MDRRRALAQMVGTAATLWGLSEVQPLSAATPSVKSTLGLVTYNCGIRRKWLSERTKEFDLFEPLAFLKHCQQLGAGGMQASLGVLSSERIRGLREFAEQHSLFIDAIINPPKDQSDLDRFEAEITTAQEVGVQAARTVIMPGRRYEQFNSLVEFRESAARGHHMLELAAPIVTKHRVRLAVENHKDQRIDERLALYKKLPSDYIGACVDTGNSFALLDDPYQVIEALAPYAFTVHFKDQAVREYEEGFLLGDIPLGQGCFDMKRMADILRRSKPDLRMNLELITRDPLKVTCLTDKFWATLPSVNGMDLVRTLRIVREHPANNLQQVTKLSLKDQVELEDANVANSLEFARLKLGF